MQNRRAAGEHRDILRVRHEVRIRYGDRVFAERDSVKVKLSRVVGAGIQRELRPARLQNYLDAGNRAMLWVVNHAADRPVPCSYSRATQRQIKHYEKQIT